jgi:hypothetical protein
VKAQSRFEKLKLARKERDVFSEKLTIRLGHGDADKLQKLSDNTDRSKSDLLRSAVRLLLVAGQAVLPFSRHLVAVAAITGATLPISAPRPTSDNGCCEDRRRQLMTKRSSASGTSQHIARRAGRRNSSKRAKVVPC